MQGEIKGRRRRRKKKTLNLEISGLVWYKLIGPLHLAASKVRIAMMIASPSCGDGI